MLSEKRKNILLVVESIDVEDSSGSKANVTLIKNLHRAGFNLQVYHYTREEIQLNGIPCYSIKENRKSFLFFLSRIERKIRYSTGRKLNKYVEHFFGFSFTLLNDRNSIATALKKIKDFEPDLVLTLSKGGSFRPHHALLEIPEWYSKWIAYIHDPYPFSCYPRPYDWVEPGNQQKRNFLLKVAEKSKYAAYPSKLLAEWMESYYAPLKGKRVIIPHQIAEDEVVSAELPEYFKKDAFTILHAGALMNARNPLSLVQAFIRFIKINPEAADHSQLLFVGRESKYSDEFRRVKKEFSQLYSTNSYETFGKVLAMQRNAAVNVILEAKGPISPFLPGKFPHCIAADKPILLLGPYYSECRRLLGENYSWWGEIDDEEEILAHIQKLYQIWLNSGNEEVRYCKIKNYLSERYLNSVFAKM